LIIAQKPTTTATQMSKALGFAKDMRKLLILLSFPVLISACAIPSSHEVSSYKCVNFKQDFALIRSVNTCPLLSNTPQPKTDKWEFYPLTSKTKEHIKSSSQYKHKLKSKSCEWPTSVRESKVFNQDTKLVITKIITRNDTVRHNRMFIHGVLNSNGIQEPWIFEQPSNSITDISKRVGLSFSKCEGST
ncbi:hypothetical protein, partial [Pseudoalteromonas sp. NBT06-2]|uniref:hypothetical protein n=1 Tax=Pseudoalteromonas sp. NBT06-2 TaxID=2025950 RepID=UPI001BAF22A4